MFRMVDISFNQYLLDLIAVTFIQASLYSFTVEPSSVCTVATNCEQTCVRLDGLEYCGCNRGYQLAADMFTCNGKPTKLYSLLESNYKVMVL